MLQYLDAVGWRILCFQMWGPGVLIKVDLRISWEGDPPFLRRRIIKRLGVLTIRSQSSYWIPCVSRVLTPSPCVFVDRTLIIRMGGHRVISGGLTSRMWTRHGHNNWDDWYVELLSNKVTFLTITRWLLSILWHWGTLCISFLRFSLTCQRSSSSSLLQKQLWGVVVSIGLR